MVKKKTENSTMVLDRVELPNKIVTLKFYAKPTGMIHDTKHILYGGLSPRAGKVFQLARKQSGAFLNPFPNVETRISIESSFGLPTGSLSPENMSESNYFRNYTLKLTREDKILNLQDPYDYLFYLVAKTQRDFVAPSLQHIVDPNLSRSTYMWYIEDEKIASQAKSKLVSRKMKAYMEFGKIEDSVPKLRQIMMEHKGASTLPTAANTHEWLHSAVGTLVEEDSEVFLNYMNDKTLPIKADIYDAVALSIIIKKEGLYYQNDDTPLRLEGKTNNIHGAIEFLLAPENSDYYAIVKKRIKNGKDV